MKSTPESTIFTRPNRSTLKTYSHLAEKKKVPSEYEITTSNMLYYVKNGGFDVKTPISAWYDQYQKNSLIHPPCWEQFVDPRHTTYAAYIQRQKDEELFLDKHSRHIEETGHDALLSESWIHLLSQMIAPLRYPWHGLQMTASYLGSMAPEGKLVIVFAFQTMDDMRRIQRIAYRMRQLQQMDQMFGEHSLSEWQTAPLWQPLRSSIEHLLITYDWLESFVALNFCFKPIFDHLVLVHFANIAKKQGDSQLTMMFHSFWEDSCWQQSWSMQLLELILKEDSNNKTIIQGWLQRWLDKLVPAILALRPLFLDDDIVFESVFSTYIERVKTVDLAVELLWR